MSRFLKPMRCSLTSLGRRWRKGWCQSIDWYLLYSGEQLLCAPECANAQRCLSSPFDAIRDESMAATEGCGMNPLMGNRRLRAEGRFATLSLPLALASASRPQANGGRYLFNCQTFCPAIVVDFVGLTKLTPALYFTPTCQTRHLRGRKVASGSKSPQFGQPTGRRHSQ